MMFGLRTEHIGVHIDQAHKFCGMAEVIPLCEESHSVVVRAREERHTWPFSYRLLTYIAITVDSRKISIFFLNQTFYIKLRGESDDDQR